MAKPSSNPGPLFELPDLDLSHLPQWPGKEAPLSAPISSTQARRVSPGTPPQTPEDFTFEHGSRVQPPISKVSVDLDLDETGDTSSALELDPDRAPISDHNRSIPSSGRQRASEPVTGRTPERATLEIDERKILSTAGYGAAPTHLWGAPRYALRVVRQRRRLRRELKHQESELQRAEAGRDELLAQLVLERRNLLEGDERFNAAFKSIAELEQTAATHQQSLSTVQERYAKALTGLDAQLSALQINRAAAEEELATRTLDLEANIRNVQRLKARQQRLQIEQRTRTQNAEPLADLQAETARLAQEEEGLRARVLAAQAHVEAAKTPLQTLSQNLLNLERERLAVSREFEVTLQTQNQELSRVQASRSSALAEIGRNLLASRPPHQGALPLDRLREAERRVRNLAYSAELHARALLWYDKFRFQQGVAVVLCGLAILVLAIAAKAVLL